MTDNNKDKAELILAIITIIVMIIGVCLGSWLSDQSANNLWHNQQRIEQKNSANAYISDLTYVNQTLSYYDGPVYPPSRIFNVLYPSWGLYYSDRQDIQKFDPQLSSDMYDFYYELLTAENERVWLNQIANTYPSDYFMTLPPEKRNQTLMEDVFYDVIYKVHDCHKKIPGLIANLTKASES